jgi:protein-export membrane protein SecD
MWKSRIIALVCVVLGVWAGYSVWQSETQATNPFRLGLDLSGGSYLVYQADVSEIDEAEIGDSMDSLRDVIERRINAFGVAEPNVQTEISNFSEDGTQHRLIVELPGVTDLDQAVEMIGQTPFLEFKVERPEAERDALLEEQQEILTRLEAGESIDFSNIEDPYYIPTELNGKYLEKSTLQFSQTGASHTGTNFQSQPIVALSFNKEGAQLFEEITRDNIGKTIAIYLDGFLISAPRVNSAISGGQAIIEGDFDIEEAKTLVGRLNSGALPIPIELVSTNTVGASLGQDAVEAGVAAGVLGLIIVAGLLLLWYRIPGLIAVIALGVYTTFMLWMFKFIPVTLTSAGIAGFIISIGIAVDANILIFERMKEEVRAGKNLYTSIETGFARAWASIRDANISSIISAIILFWFGTPLIKGFALTFGLGIIISMITAVTITRYMMLSLAKKKGSQTKTSRFLFGSGFNRSSK